MNVSLSRNAPCVCGSGKKYKRCCGQERVAAQPVRQPPSSDVTPAELNRLVSLINAGRYSELEAAARELSRQRPNAGVVWKALGIALWAQGKDALAALKQAAGLLPRDAEVHSDLGTALRTLGKLDEAVGYYRWALAIKPDFAEAHNNLGSALQDLGQLDAALASYQRALEIKPDFVTAHYNVGDCGLAQGQLDAAVASYRRALDLKPLYAEAHNGLGMALRLQGRAVEAEASCRRALEIDPKLTAAVNFLAQLHADRGEFGQAEELFKRAILLEPDSPEAWGGIAGLRKMTSSDAGWLSEAQRIAAKGLAPRREVYLRYAIGKYFDDVKEYAQAFENYRRANELTRKYGARHERGEVSLAVDRIIASYDGEWMRRSRSTASTSSRPVFIVGMPRSGTTLAEQILAAHPSVHGAGELSYWIDAAARFARGMSNAAGALEDAGEGQGGSVRILGTLAEDYLRLLGTLSADALRVVDKLPTNFMCLGLIHAALPNARIVHLERNPIDTCLSIYFQDFHTAHTYANDLEDLAHYYTEYRRLMQHWRSSLPVGTMLEVPYEGLTEDPEAWSRAMLEFLDLPWDPACLNFQDSGRPILTFSKWQARQRIHKSSVERWRNYAPFIAPLLPLQETPAMESTASAYITPPAAANPA